MAARRWAATLILVGTLATPGSAAFETAQRAEACVADYSENTDYFPAKARVEHALAFTISYHKHYKVVRIKAPQDPKTQDVLLLVQCGTPVPPRVGDLANASLVTIPVHTLGANEDLSLNRARVLGHTERVVAMGSGGIYAEELRNRWVSGSAVAIGESFHGQPDYEKLLSASPDVVFLSTASLSRADALLRARALGIAAVPSLSWIEPSVIGQAEWLHFVAAFFNDEDKANRILTQLKARYNKLSKHAQAQPATPLVIWLDPAGQRDKWKVPEANWLAELVNHAGGSTPWQLPRGAPDRVVTTEQILALGERIDAFITTSVALRSPGSLGAMEQLPAVKRGRVFDVHRRSRPEQDAYDWYESAVVDVDLVLEDVVALLHPNLLPGHRFRHLQPARKADILQ